MQLKLDPRNAILVLELALKLTVSEIFNRLTTSGVLNTICPDRKRLQEAMLEVVSSEVSYLKSLNILIRHFVQSPKLMPSYTPTTSNVNASDLNSGGQGVITKRDAKVLFSDIISVSYQMRNLNTSI